MSKKRAFFLSLIGTLLVLLPVYLATAAILLTRTQPVEIVQSGVPVAQPTRSDARTLLLMTGPEEPETFVLLRFDAFTQEVCTLALPAEAVMLVNGQPLTLREAAQQAGPAQAAAAIEETLSVDVDNYFYCDADSLLALTEDFSAARIPLSNYLSAEALAQLRLDLPGVDTLSLTPRMLAEVLDARLAAPDLQTLLRAEGYLAFLRVSGQPLAHEIPDAVRAVLAKSSTDLSAVALYDYERIFGFLEREPPEYRAGVLPGTWNQDRYELGESAPQTAQGYLGSAAPEQEESETPGSV